MGILSKTHTHVQRGAHTQTLRVVWTINALQTQHICNDTQVQLQALLCFFLCTYFMSQHTHVQTHVHILPAGCLLHHKIKNKKNILIHQFRGGKIKRCCIFLVFFFFLRHFHAVALKPQSSDKMPFMWIKPWNNNLAPSAATHDLKVSQMCDSGSHMFLISSSTHWKYPQEMKKSRFLGRDVFVDLPATPGKFSLLPPPSRWCLLVGLIR